MKVVPDISMRAALKNKKARENATFSLAFLVRRLQFGYLRFQTRIGNQQDRIRFGGKEQQNEHTTSCSITIAS